MVRTMKRIIAELNMNEGKHDQANESSTISESGLKEIARQISEGQQVD